MARLAHVRIHLIRHATAETTAPDGEDASRRLTDEGEVEATLLAQALHVLGVRPAAVLSSPYRRCVDTARPIAARLELAATPDRRLEPGADAADLAAALDHHAHDADGDVVVVGHEPDLSELIRHLTGARVEMAKGAVARVEMLSLRPGGSTLHWLLRPKQVRLIARSR